MRLPYPAHKAAKHALSPSREKGFVVPVFTGMTLLRFMLVFACHRATALWIPYFVGMTGLGDGIYHSQIPLGLGRGYP